MYGLLYIYILHIQHSYFSCMFDLPERVIITLLWASHLQVSPQRSGALTTSTSISPLVFKYDLLLFLYLPFVFFIFFHTLTRVLLHWLYQQNFSSTRFSLFFSTFLLWLYAYLINLIPSSERVRRYLLMSAFIPIYT